MLALLSVYDKTGIAELGRGLVDLGYEVVSTGGTLAALEATGVPVTAVSDVTDFPEILDGRVKTLHPRIHGGLLARRDDPAHMSALEAHQISPIDVVGANLYPFAETIARPDVALDALEQIDIGGPAMIRAAAKNFPGVVVLTDPADYPPVLDELREGTLLDTRRRALAAKAFAHTAAYDAVVAEYLRDPQEWPQEFAVAGRLARTLRYGENPQQRAAAYRRLRAGQPEHGYWRLNNSPGRSCRSTTSSTRTPPGTPCRGLPGPPWLIVKHTIPCGLSEQSELASAFDEALRGDPVSAFGGIVALNRPVDGERPGTWLRSSSRSSSPRDSTDEAIETLGKRKSLRLLGIPMWMSSAPAGHGASSSWDVRPIAGGLLVQTADFAPADPSSWQVVTNREPSAQEMDDLAFAWHAVRHVKSNAIVLARDRALTGVGSGQPNRLESVRIAVDKASQRAAGSVLASDAFFPFSDGLETAIAAGVTAAIQPGGSVRDDAVIAAADRAGVGDGLHRDAPLPPLISPTIFVRGRPP